MRISIGSSARSLALAVAAGLSAMPSGSMKGAITPDELTAFKRARPQRRNPPRHRYDPVTRRYISAAELRAMGRNPKYNNHGQPFGVSGNKLTRKAEKGQIGKTVLR